MRTYFETLWEQLRGTFWFVPGVMVIMAVVLSILLIAIDQSEQFAAITQSPWVYAGEADGARAVLSTIVGSMITVAGVTFSITIAALANAATQLGPRLLSNFMRDRGNQIVLGTFVATFVYALLVLRVIRSEDGAFFVPHLSVTTAIVLSVISMGVLVFFFHHVSTLMQAQSVIASVGNDLETSIERLFPSQSSATAYEYELRDEGDIPDDFKDGSQYITSHVSGYLQAVNYEDLQQIATKNDILMWMLLHPGEFVPKGSEVIAVYPGENLTDAIREDIQDALVVGAGRLHLQDVKFSIQQLVEIAVRALSPGINDPFTAIACLDQFSATLSDLAERSIPSGYYYDKEENLRIINESVTFAGIVNASFDQIRRYGRSDVDVTVRLLEVIAIIIARAKADDQRQPLIQQARMIKRASDETVFEEHDRETINARYELILRVLKDDDQPVTAAQEEQEREDN